MLEILYQALASARGIVVKTNDVERLRAKLYALRRETGDPALKPIALVPSPTAPEEELWIVRKEPDAS